MALKSLPTRTTDTREAMHSPLPSCSIISGPLISLALEENNGNYKKHNKVRVVDQAFVFQTTIQSQSGSQMPSICLCRYCNKHSTPVSQFTVQVKPVFFQSLWINTQSKKTQVITSIQMQPQTQKLLLHQSSWARINAVIFSLVQLFAQTNSGISHSSFIVKPSRQSHAGCCCEYISQRSVSPSFKKSVS